MLARLYFKNKNFIYKNEFNEDFFLLGKRIDSFSKDSFAIKILKKSKKDFYYKYLRLRVEGHTTLATRVEDLIRIGVKISSSVASLGLKSFEKSSFFIFSWIL